MDTLDTIGWLAVRGTVAFVYLYALYMNTRDAASRRWLLEHTAYMFPGTPDPGTSITVRVSAFGGMLVMLFGSVSILLGIEGRLGALALLAFTACGVYQHKREREVAMRVAEALAHDLSNAAPPGLATLQWSAYSGHFSSGLKNWALCGIFVAIAAWGTGPLSVSDTIGRLLR